MTDEQCKECQSASQTRSNDALHRYWSKERGAGREQRGRNLRPLPQPMDGSNTAIGGYLSQALVQSASRGKVCSKKIPGVFDSARDMLPVAHDDSPTLLGTYTHVMG